MESLAYIHNNSVVWKTYGMDSYWVSETHAHHTSSPDDDVSCAGTGPDLHIGLSRVHWQEVQEDLQWVLGHPEPHGDGPRLCPPWHHQWNCHHLPLVKLLNMWGKNGKQDSSIKFQLKNPTRDTHVDAEILGDYREWNNKEVHFKELLLYLDDAVTPEHCPCVRFMYNGSKVTFYADLLAFVRIMSGQGQETQQVKGKRAMLQGWTRDYRALAGLIFIAFYLSNSVIRQVIDACSCPTTIVGIITTFVFFCIHTTL